MQDNSDASQQDEKEANKQTAKQSDGWMNRRKQQVTAAAAGENATSKAGAAINQSANNNANSCAYHEVQTVCDGMLVNLPCWQFWHVVPTAYVPCVWQPEEQEKDFTKGRLLQGVETTSASMQHKNPKL